MRDNGRASRGPGARRHGVTLLVLLGLVAAVAALPGRASAHAWACYISASTGIGYQNCSGHAVIDSANCVQVRAVSGPRHPYTYIKRQINGVIYGTPQGPYSDDNWHTSGVSSTVLFEIYINDDAGGTGQGYYYSNHWFTPGGCSPAFAAQGAWARSAPGEPIADAVVFEPGVDYTEAVKRIFIAQRTGRFPTGASPAPALPEGTVLLQPTDAAAGIVVSLKAPYGFDPATGQATAPSVAQPGDLTAEEAKQAWLERRPGAPWPREAWVDVPILPSCMVISDRASRGRECAPGDAPVIDFNRLHGSRLP